MKRLILALMGIITGIAVTALMGGAMAHASAWIPCTARCALTAWPWQPQPKAVWHLPAHCVSAYIPKCGPLN